MLTKKKGIARSIYKFRRKLWFAYQVGNDKRRGVDFFTKVDNKGTPEALSGHYAYEATGFLFERYLKEFLCRQDHAADCIIDVGCGKGRMLEFFSALGFCKSDGLEYSPELAEIARKNMKVLGLPCQVFTGDAAGFDGYDAYNWFYLYNPFSHDIMLRFIGKIQESLQRKPRRITIIYTNPTCEDDFAQAGFNLGYKSAGMYWIRVITNGKIQESSTN